MVTGYTTTKIGYIPTSRVSKAKVFTKEPNHSIPVCYNKRQRNQLRPSFCERTINFVCWFLEAHKGYFSNGLFITYPIVL